MVRVKQVEFAVGLICVACVLCNSVLFHSVLFRVNRRLPPDKKIKHGFLVGPLRGRVAGEYRDFFPNGHALVFGRMIRFGIWVSFFALILIWAWELWAGH